MRIRPKGSSDIVEGDLTPMIDMTFQLIAFFMLVINFSDIEQDQRIQLPASQLAQPPQSPYEDPLTIHLTAGDKFIYGGNELADLTILHSALLRETQLIQRQPSRKIANVTVVIRADENAKVGLVQEVMQTCQNLEFENFALRGKVSEAPTLGTP